MRFITYRLGSTQMQRIETSGHIKINKQPEMLKRLRIAQNLKFLPFNEWVIHL